MTDEVLFLIRKSDRFLAKVYVEGHVMFVFPGYRPQHSRRFDDDYDDADDDLPCNVYTLLHVNHGPMEKAVCIRYFFHLRHIIQYITKPSSATDVEKREKKKNIEKKNRKYNENSWFLAA